MSTWNDDIFDAVWNGKIQALKELISKGVNVNVTDEDSWTPLYIASRFGHTEIVKILIAAGADTDKQGYYGRFYTPLEIAREKGNMDIVALLSQPEAIAELRAPSEKIYHENQMANQQLKELKEIHLKVLSFKGDNLELENFSNEIYFEIEKKIQGLKNETEKLKSTIDNQLNNCEKVKAIVEQYYEKIQKIQLEMSVSRNQLQVYEKSLKQNNLNLNKFETEMNDLSKALFETQKMKIEIKKIFLRMTPEWKNKLEQGNPSLWNEKDWDNLFIDLGMESWNEERKKIGISNFMLLTDSESSLLNKSNEIKLFFGDIRYIKLVLKEIETNHSITYTFDNNSNFNQWTVENVSIYFQNKNMESIAKILLESKINGPVLKSLTSDDMFKIGLNSGDEELIKNELTVLLSTNSS